MQENVLDKIFDSRARHAAKENAVDHAGIARVESPESCPIALLRSADECPVDVADAIRRRVHDHCKPTAEWSA